MKIFSESAEEMLVRNMDQIKAAPSGSCLHFHFSELHPDNRNKNRVALFVQLIKDNLAKTKSTVYLCADHDIIVIDENIDDAIIKNVISDLKFFFADDPIFKNVDETKQSPIYTSYNLKTNWGDFYYICKYKLVDASGQEKAAEVISEGEREAGTSDIGDIFENAIEERKKRRGLHILIVEDQHFARELLRNALAKKYRITTAKDGEETLREYRNYAPDIVFLDIELPDASGHDLLTSIIGMDPDAFVVMVTANNYPKDVKRALTSGARGFIIKPFSKQKINHYIEMYVSERKQFFAKSIL